MTIINYEKNKTVTNWGMGDIIVTCCGSGAHEIVTDWGMRIFKGFPSFYIVKITENMPQSVTNWGCEDVIVTSCRDELVTNWG